MKYGLAALTLLFFSNAMATDYGYLVPKYSMSLEEVRRMIPQVDAEKMKIGQHLQVLLAEKMGLINLEVQKKDQAIQLAKEQFVRCRQEPACVSEVNNQLSYTINAIHQSINNINVKYAKLTEQETNQMAADSLALEQVLLSMKNSVLAHVIDTEIKKRDGQNGIVIETGLVFQVTTTYRETIQVLRQQIYNTWSWNISEGKYYSFATYFYRTPTEQRRVLLAFNLGVGNKYDVIRKELMSPLAETDRAIFELPKAALAKGLIEDLAVANPYSLVCVAGKPINEPGACVSPLKIDAVKLN